jgi:NADH dehydrogenase FAD-containing subunit
MVKNVVVIGAGVAGIQVAQNKQLVDYRHIWAESSQLAIVLYVLMHLPNYSMGIIGDVSIEVCSQRRKT